MPERMARLLARASAALFAVGALYYLTLGGEYSVFDLGELQSERAASLARIDSLQTQLDSLTAWADSLESDPGAIERVAREEYGFIRDGERLYRFVPRDSETQESETESGGS